MLRRTHDKIVADLRREHQRERAAWAEREERLLDRLMLAFDKPVIAPFQPDEPTPLFDVDLDAYPDLDPAQPFAD